MLKNDLFQVLHMLGVSQLNTNWDYNPLLLETNGNEGVYRKYPIILALVFSFSNLFIKVMQQPEKCLCFKISARIG